MLSDALVHTKYILTKCNVLACFAVSSSSTIAVVEVCHINLYQKYTHICVVYSNEGMCTTARVW